MSRSRRAVETDSTIAAQAGQSSTLIKAQRQVSRAWRCCFACWKELMISRDAVRYIRCFQRLDFFIAQSQRQGSDRIRQMLRFRGADDRRGDAMLLCDPRQCNLCPRYAARLGDTRDFLDDLPVGIDGLRIEGAAKGIGFAAFTDIVPVAGQPAAREGAPWHHGDALVDAKR